MSKSDRITSRRIGYARESEAVEFLTGKGLLLLLRNYQCRVGEIDLIMRDGSQLVFVEVRWRNSILFGNPVETVDRRKQLKLIRCAQYFLQRNTQAEQYSCRFDVLGITTGQTGSGDTFHWVRNAFQA